MVTTHERETYGETNYQNVDKLRRKQITKETLTSVNSKRNEVVVKYLPQNVVFFISFKMNAKRNCCWLSILMNPKMVRKVLLSPQGSQEVTETNGQTKIGTI